MPILLLLLSFICASLMWSVMFLIITKSLYCRRSRDTEGRHVTPQLLYAANSGPTRQCYVANAGFRCTKQRGGTAPDNPEEKGDCACEMTVDSLCGPRQKCSGQPPNPSPQPRPPPDGRIRYKVIGYPGNMNTFKPPRATRSDSDASRELHGFTACRYSRCRSRDAGEADDDVLDLKGTFVNEK